MKMSDVFGDNVLLAVDGAGYCINQIHYFNPSKNCDCTDEIHSSPESAEMIHHAINNHDRMVEENKNLLIALCDIQSMCIGDIAMGYKLDPESIGIMIYEATGMTHPELSAKLNQEGEE